MSENIVDSATAENEFNRFVDLMDLDFNSDDMDAEDLTSFNKTKRRLIKAIERGSLIINDNGEAVYTPVNEKTKHKEAITFHERTGSALMAMDSKKKNEDVKKTYAVMAEMCKLSPAVFASMVGIDIKICESIFMLLMD